VKTLSVKLTIWLMLVLLLWVGCGDNIITPTISAEQLKVGEIDTVYWRLIYPSEVADAARKEKDILQKSEIYLSVDFVSIDVEGIMTHELFTLQFGGRNIIIKKERVNLKGPDSYTFVGSNDNGERVSLSVLKSDVIGVIETTAGSFTIRIIESGEYAVIRLDRSKMMD